MAVYEYFCRGCEAVFHGGWHPNHLRLESDVPLPSDEVNLVCLGCGTAHIIWQFERRGIYTRLLVQREPETMTITREFIQERESRKAERLRERGADEVRITIFNRSRNDRCSRTWGRLSSKPRINLLPGKDRVIRQATSWAGTKENVFFVVLGIPYFVGMFIFALSQAGLRDTIMRLRGEERPRPDWRGREIARVKGSLAKYREVAEIQLPAPPRWSKPCRAYIGYEVDNPPPPDLFEQGMPSLVCAGCNVAGQLIIRIYEGMTCPRCKSGTLEENESQRDEADSIS